MLVVFLGLGACSGADGASMSPQTAREDVADERTAEVQVAYKDYWVQLVDALDPPDPRHEGLLGRVAGTERQRVKQLIAMRGQAGEAVRGRHEHQIELEEQDASSARLTDCLTLRTNVVDADTGQRISKDVPGPYPVAATLEHSDDVWRVTEVSASSHACPRTPDGSQQGSDEESGE